jgi:hypothetical protein
MKKNAAFLTWPIELSDSEGFRIDADQLPTCRVFKEVGGVRTLTSEAVTIIKPAATTGVYDGTFNPATRDDGFRYWIEETVYVNGNANPHVQTWTFTIDGKAELINAVQQTANTIDSNVTDAKAKTDAIVITDGKVEAVVEGVTGGTGSSEPVVVVASIAVAVTSSDQTIRIEAN